MNDADYGICRQNYKDIVIYQNSYCKTVCENQMNGICKFKYFSACKLVSKGQIERKIYFTALETIQSLIINKDQRQSKELILTFDVCALPGSEHLDKFFYSSKIRLQTILNSIQNLLTPRQIEILDLRIRGNSSTEITKKLNISINTFKTHIKNIYLSLPQELKYLIKTKKI